MTAPTIADELRGEWHKIVGALLASDSRCPSAADTRRSVIEYQRAARRSN